MKQKKISKAILGYICIICLFFINVLPTIAHAEINNKIKIETVQELAKIGLDINYPLSADYILVNDIDMSEYPQFNTIGGGYNSSSGATSGDNVFSGTFDGQGHVISNLKLEPKAGGNAQIGLFGIIASQNPNDYAEVKNIILKDVDINVNIQGTVAVGALAGEVNGYAQVSNVAVLGGSITTGSYGDLIGVGGVIGEVRTAESSIGNRNISIENLYNSATIKANSSTNNKYAGGIIGRIRYGACKIVSECVNVGDVDFKGQMGYAIASISSGENEAISTLENCYYLENTSIAVNNEASSVYISQLTNGQLLNGLSEQDWSAINGFYLIPKMCEVSAIISPLDFISINFAQGENFGNVKTNFSVPTLYKDTKIIWKASPFIPIENGQILVEQANAGVYVLTATLNGKSKSYQISVNMDISISFEQDYALEGKPLTVVLDGDNSEINYIYQWKVGNQIVNGNTGNSYTPTKNDLEKFISASILIDGAVADTVQMYFSKLPVVYINTNDGSSEIDKDTYKAALCKIQGNSIYNKNTTTLYEGDLEIKGRGNSTWGMPKKPYKLKLNKKTDMFGFGKSKHWVLLANYLDLSMMRNELSYNLSGDLGIPYMQSINTVLVMNGQYIGTYQFCEQIRIDKDRVNIFDWEKAGEDVADEIAAQYNLSKDDTANLEEAMAQDFSWVTTNKFNFNGTTYNLPQKYENLPYNGGYLLELDSYFDEVSKFQTSLYQPIMFKSPEFLNTNQTMFNYVHSYLNSFEAAIQNPDFHLTANNESFHYSDRFDIDSLTDYWLVTEVFENEDAMKKSTYLYQDIDGLYKMGPVWDMDWACGATHSAATNPEVWQTVNFSADAQNNQWYKYLIGDPYFVLKVYNRYWNIRDRLESMIKDNGLIEQNRIYLKEAAQTNINKWNGGTYDTYVNEVKNFLTNRLSWLDKQFKDMNTLLNSLGKYKSSNLIDVSVQGAINRVYDIDIISTVDTSSAKEVLFQINGKNVQSVEIENGKASLNLNSSDIELNNGENIVSVFAVDSNSKIMMSNNSAVTNYTLFDVENDEVALTGNVFLRGNPALGNTLTAIVDNTNNTGELSYIWTANDVVIDEATNYYYTLTQNEVGKTIQVIVSSSNEVGSLQSETTDIVLQQASKDNIIINQIYGAGTKADAPISHDFIELYNPTSKDINLEGYSIVYVSNGSSSPSDNSVLELDGIIPSGYSYLIRCSQNTTANLKYEIAEYDKQWQQAINNKQYQIVLYKGDNFVDGLSIGEKFVEGKALTAGDISKQKSARRNNFVDTDNNIKDFITISYRDDITDDKSLQAVRPRSLADGKWADSKTDKLQEAIDEGNRVYKDKNSKVNDLIGAIRNLSNAIVEFNQ